MRFKPQEIDGPLDDENQEQSGNDSAKLLGLMRGGIRTSFDRLTARIPLRTIMRGGQFLNLGHFLLDTGHTDLHQRGILPLIQTGTRTFPSFFPSSAIVDGDVHLFAHLIGLLIMSYI